MDVACDRGDVRGISATEQSCERHNELVSRCATSGRGREADASRSGRPRLYESWDNSFEAIYGRAKTNRNNSTGCHHGRLFHMRPVLAIGPARWANATTARREVTAAHVVDDGARTLLEDAINNLRMNTRYHRGVGPEQLR